MLASYLYSYMSLFFLETFFQFYILRKSFHLSKTYGFVGIEIFLKQYRDLECKVSLHFFKGSEEGHISLSIHKNTSNRKFKCFLVYKIDSKHFNFTETTCVDYKKTKCKS